MQKLYSVVTPADKVEGRGPMRTLVTVDRKELAEALSQEPEIYEKFGVMGTNTLQIHEIMVCGGMSEALEHLKKLSK